jgi:hypothetical protein
MIDKNLMEAAFEEWYKDMCVRTSLMTWLGKRPNRIFFACFKVGYTRGHAQGVLDGLARADERKRRLDSAMIPSLRPSPDRQPSGKVVTARSETAETTHIPIVIEGNITLDRDRPIGQYMDDPEE